MIVNYEKYSIIQTALVAAFSTTFVRVLHAMLETELLLASLALEFVYFCQFVLATGLTTSMNLLFFENK